MSMNFGNLININIEEINIVKVTANPEPNLSYFEARKRKNRVEDYKRDLKLFCKAFHQQLIPLLGDKTPEDARCGILVSTRKKSSKDENKVFIPIAVYDPKYASYNSSNEYGAENFTGYILSSILAQYSNEITKRGINFKYLVYKMRPKSGDIPPIDKEYSNHYLPFQFSADRQREQLKDYLGIALCIIKQEQSEQHLELLGAINFDHAQPFGLPSIRTTVENYRVEALLFLLIRYLARIGNNYDLFKAIQDQPVKVE